MPQLDADQTTMMNSRRLRFASFLAIGILSAISIAGVVDERADAINVLAPYWQLPSALLLLFASRGRGLGVGALVTAALLVGSFLVTLGPTLGSPDRIATAGTGSRLRIVTFNAWKNNRDLGPAARWLSAQNADVIVLQEIDWGPSGLPARLRSAYPFQVDCLETRRCSTAILSRVRPLQTAGLAHGDPENRKALSAAWLHLAGRCAPFDVIGVHFNHAWPLPILAHERADILAFLVHRNIDQAVLAGDFNLPPWTVAFTRLRRATGLTDRAPWRPTWPSSSVLPQPLFAIDHVLAGHGWITLGSFRGPQLGSDHYPLVVDLAARCGSCANASAC